MKDVSAETGVSGTTLSRMKNEGRAPDAASLVALGAWAGINPIECTKLAPQPAAQASESATPCISLPPIVKTVDGYDAVLHSAFMVLLSAHQDRGDKLKTAGAMVAQLKHEAQTFQLVPIEQCPKCGWQQPKLASESAEARDGVVVSAYRVGLPQSAIHVERVSQIVGPDRWAVRQNGDVLNNAGMWEWGPRPSERDDAFLARCRFSTSDAAIDAALAAQHKEQA